MSDIKEYQTVNKEVRVGCKCDVCGVEVKGYAAGWFHFNTHHSEWGNYSCESYEYYDVCSAECYVSKLTESVKDMSSYKRSGRIAEMSIEFAEKLLQKLKS